MPASNASSDRRAERADERRVPWADDRRQTYERLHRYWFAAQFADGKRVLDLGCGDGAGTALLAETAAVTLGVELDETAYDHARADNRHSNVSFRLGSVLDLGDLPARSYDLIVCFGLIEQFENPDPLVATIKRLLAPDGIVLFSAVDRDPYAQAGYENPFHLRELSRNELRTLLDGWFSFHELWDQSFVIGSQLRREDGAEMAGVEQIDVLPTGARWERVTPPPATHLVALASQAPLPALPGRSLLLHRDAGPVAAHDAPSPDAIAEHHELWEPERLYRQVAIYETALSAQMRADRGELTQLKATRAWRTVMLYWRLRLTLRRWVHRSAR